MENFVSSDVDINERESEDLSQYGFSSHGGAQGTVLHFDCVDSEMTRYLIAHGADIHVKNGDGDTPLHDALRHHDGQRFLTLLDYMPSNADLNVEDKLGRTIFHSALEIGYLPALVKLINDPRVRLVFHNEMTPLEVACTWGKEETMRLLLASSRVIEVQREKTSKISAKLSVLFHAVLQGWEDLAVQTMQSLPTDIENEVDKDGRTILHHAVMENWHDLLDQCLDRIHRPKLNKMDKNGMTALHMAAKVRNRYAAIRLLDLGAQPEVSNHEGKNPLHVAAEVGSEQVLNLLLDRANVNVIAEIDNEKRTVLHYAATWDLVPINQRLVNLSETAVIAKDRHGRTPAHLASLFGCPGVLNLLLNLGKISVNARDYYGNTLLHCAANGGSEACIKTLLSKSGLKIDLLNRYGKSALGGSQPQSKSSNYSSTSTSPLLNDEDSTYFSNYQFGSKSKRQKERAKWQGEKWQLVKYESSRESEMPNERRHDR